MSKTDIDSLNYYYANKEWKLYFIKLKLLGDTAIVRNNSKVLLREIEPYLLRIKAKDDAALKFSLRKGFTQQAARYNNLEDYQAALTWYLKAHEMVDDKFCLDVWAWYVENEIAIIYNILDDLEKSEYFAKLCEISLSYFGKYKNLSRLYSNLGDLYKTRRDFKKAEYNYSQGLKIAKDINYEQGIFACSNGLGDIYSQSGKFVAAETLLFAAFSATERIDSLNKKYNENKYGIYWNLANLYRIRKSKEKAILAFEHSQKFLKLNYPDTNRREYAKLYLDFANLYFDYNDLELTEKYLQKGIQALLPEFKSMRQLPIKQDLHHENTFTDLFLLCAQLFRKKYIIEKNPDFLKLSIGYVDLGLCVTDKIRSGIMGDPSKLINIKFNKKLVDLGIQCLWELKPYQTENQIWDQARYFFNYSKGLLFNDKNLEMEVYGSLSVRNKERIQQLENQELELHNETTTYSNKDSINQELFLIRKQIKEILGSSGKSKAKIEYPKNYIEYNVQDSFVYVLSSVNDQKKFERIGGKKELENISLEINLQLLSSEKNDFIGIYKIAFNFLLGFQKECFPNKLTIIPDGIIQFIPFEILENQFGEYLISKTTIAYSNSYGQLLRTKGNVDKPVFIYSVKPEYPVSSTEIIAQSRGNISPLLYTSLEIDALRELYGNKMIVDTSNSKSNMINQMRTAQIVHYAGHAFAKGDSAYLILPGEENRLSIDEIKSFKNPTSMIVLSACETGLGEWEHGEGIRSLGKSFQESGAESVVMSLWSVNDESTAKIMGSFYANLEKGLSKDESLRKAKLEFILNASLERKHPYYWAGFVGVGDMSPLKEQNCKIPFLQVFLFLLALNALIYFRKRKKNSQL